MPAIPSIGVLANFGMNANTTSSPAAATEAYEFLSENLTTAREVIRTEGLRGTRLHPVERIRQGRQTPGGDITMQPTYAELVNLLPRIIGAAVGGAGTNSYTISDTVPVAFQTVIDRIAKVFTYTGCRVGKAVFKSAPGQPLELAMTVQALAESIGNSGTFAALTVANNPPFIFEDGVLTLGGTTYQILDFETTIDWKLKEDRWVNSLTRTDLPSLDVQVLTKFTVPFTSDTAALYDASAWAQAGSPLTYGITGNINFNAFGAGAGAAGVSLGLVFGNLVFPAEKSPNVAGRDEIGMVLSGEARRVGQSSPYTSCLVATLDATL